MAQFAIHLHIPPHRYYALTVAEQQALITEWNDSNKRR